MEFSSGAPLLGRQNPNLGDTLLNGSSVYTKAGSPVNAFVTTLITGGSLALLQVIIFILFKDNRPELYLPKTFLVPKRERTRPPRPGPVDWLKPIFQRADDDFLKKAGLDGFFLCRYLIVLLKIFVPMVCPPLPCTRTYFVASFPILFSIHNLVFRVHFVPSYLHSYGR
jgi:hypothetical protein